MINREIMREHTASSLERECSNWDRGQCIIVTVVTPVILGLLMGSIFFNHIL